MITPAVPRTGATGVPLCEEINVLGPTFGGDVRDVPTEGKMARGVGGIADRDRNTGVTSDVTHLLVRLNRVDNHVHTSVSTHVSVVSGEPSGINVVREHGFCPRIDSTKRSGRSTTRHACWAR